MQNDNDPGWSIVVFGVGPDQAYGVHNTADDWGQLYEHKNVTELGFFKSQIYMI